MPTFRIGMPIDRRDRHADNRCMRKIDAIKHFGTQKKLATAINRAQPTVAGWGEFPPLEAQIDIEVATNGLLKAELTAEQRAVLSDRRRRATDTTPRTAA